LLPDQVNQSLSLLLVSLPDSVTSYNDEIVVFTQLDHLDIGVSCNRLAMVLEIDVLFIVVVA
jgi:hypothetical protein